MIHFPRKHKSITIRFFLTFDIYIAKVGIIIESEKHLKNYSHNPSFYSETE